MSKRSVGIQAATMMSLSGALVMFGYEIVRSVSNTLFNRDYGVYYQPLVMTLIPFTLSLVLYAYNKLIDQQGPKRCFTISMIWAGMMLFICWVGFARGYRVFSPILYLFREAYIVVLIEHMWSFINSVLNESEAKGHNGKVLVISTLGAVAGGVFVNRTAVLFGTHNLLLMLPPLCLGGLLFGRKAYGIVEDQFLLKRTEPQESDKKQLFGLDAFRNHRILVILLAIVSCSQIYGTIVTLIFQNNLVQSFPTPDAQTAFSGLFFAFLNVVSVALQGLLSPYLLRHVKIQYVQVGIAIVNLGAMFLAFLFGGIYLAAFSLLVFKSLDYSIFRTSKEIFYIPLSFSARFKAKAVIDVFAHRCSKGLITMVLSLLQVLGLGLSLPGLAILGTSSSLLWLFSTLPLQKGELAETCEDALSPSK